MNCEVNINKIYNIYKKFLLKLYLNLILFLKKNMNIMNIYIFSFKIFINVINIIIVQVLVVINSIFKMQF